MKIKIESFGRKYGPIEADIILDARCMENPFWVESLRHLSGKDEPVQNFILSNEDSRTYLKNLGELMKLHAAMAEKRGKTRLSIAVGCTGGRHRSVMTAEYLAGVLGEVHEVELSHRDIEKEA